MIVPDRRGPKVQFAVKYQGGRKEFDRLEGTDPAVSARAFAALQRTKEKGWAELTRVTTEMIEKKR